MAEMSVFGLIGVILSSTFNFFECKTDFGENEPAKMEFVCIICYKIITEDFCKASSNLNHHLQYHNDGVVHKELESYFNAKNNYKNEKVKGNKKYFVR